MPDGFLNIKRSVWLQLKHFCIVRIWLFKYLITWDEIWVLYTSVTSEQQSMMRLLKPERKNMNMFCLKNHCHCFWGCERHLTGWFYATISHANVYCENLNKSYKTKDVVCYSMKSCFFLQLCSTSRSMSKCLIVANIWLWNCWSHALYPWSCIWWLSLITAFNEIVWIAGLWWTENWFNKLPVDYYKEEAVETI